MEMKRSMKRSTSVQLDVGGGMDVAEFRKLSPWGGGGSVGRISSHLLVGMLLICLLALFTMAILPGVDMQGLSKLSLDLRNVGSSHRVLQDGGLRRHRFEADKAFNIEMITSSTMNKRLPDGLLASDINDKSCRSKYEFALYRKESWHKPSLYLQKRLRNYEALHKRCASYTEFYKNSMHQLKSNQSMGDVECKYLVWISYRHSGLGNKMFESHLSILICSPYRQGLTDRQRNGYG